MPLNGLQVVNLEIGTRSSMLIVTLSVVIAVMVMLVMLPFRVLFDPIGMMFGHPVRIVLMPPVGVAPDVMAIIIADVLRKGRSGKHAEYCRKDKKSR